MRKLRMKLRSICFTASVVYHYENRPARALRGGGGGLGNTHLNMNIYLFAYFHKHQ